MIAVDVSSALCVALQQGLPLASRPFNVLAREVGCTEDDVLDEVARLRGAGLVRRFGAVFDTRRLGYRSVLCAVAAADCDAAAAAVTPLAGVTHCYRREPCSGTLPGMPALWFTLSAPADIFPAMQDEVCQRLSAHTPEKVYFLPATRRYKVDVVFGAATRAREEATEDTSAPLTGKERAVVAALQGDTHVCADYFAGLAARLDMKEWDLLSLLEIWRRTGRLKRVGLLLAHRQAGYTANGMCCWRIAGDTCASGRALAASADVTHCYARPSIAPFDYNLYAMVHAHSVEEAEAKFARLDDAVAGAQGAQAPSTMLISTREYKKTSMTFFV